MRASVERAADEACWGCPSTVWGVNFHPAHFATLDAAPTPHLRLPGCNFWFGLEKGLSDQALLLFRICSEIVIRCSLCWR